MNPKYIAVAVLVAIGAHHAWLALVYAELPQFHLAISGLAFALAVVISVRRFEARRSAPARPRTAAQKRFGILLAVSGALGAVLWIVFGPWRPQTAFDIIGFLFVIENIGQIAVLGLLVLVSSAGLALLVHR